MIIYDNQYLVDSQKARDRYNRSNTTDWSKAHNNYEKNLKRLRKKHDVRYFGCGEYGSMGCRPHYHLILFGWFPADWKNGSSKELQDLWPFGFNSVDDCNFRTRDYVARYTTKKLFKKDDDSFICMSTNPGIGKFWLENHYEIFKNDRIIF